MDKCKECPWKSNLRMCTTVYCELHLEEPIIHFIREIRELENEVDSYQDELAVYKGY